MDMIIPYGAKFRVENLMKINLYVTMVALSEIDFTPSDDFDLNLDQGTPPKAKATGMPQSPSTYERDTLTSPLRSKKAMADEIKGKHQQVMDSKPTITDDSWTDQHNQDFPYLFADGSELQDSSGVDSSTGREYWSGDGRIDVFWWPVDLQTHRGKASTKVCFFLDELYGEVRINKRIAKMRNSESLAKQRKKAVKRRRRLKRQKAEDLMKRRKFFLWSRRESVEEGIRGEEEKKMKFVCCVSILQVYDKYNIDKKWTRLLTERPRRAILRF